MQILEDENDGLQVCNPEKTCWAERLMDGFVDDTTAWANQFVKEMQHYSHAEFDNITAYEFLNDLVSKTTQLAQNWEELL